MIIDAHVHYGGESQTYEVHSVEEILALAAASGVDRIVQVTSKYGGSNEASLEGMHRYPDGVFGVIGILDVLADDAGAKLREIAAMPGMLGFRVQSRAMPSANTLADPRLPAALAVAEEIGFAMQVYAPFQAAETRDIARRFPKLRILADHMAVRFQENHDNTDIFRLWPDVLALAAEPNVWIKVSYFPEASRAFDRFPFPEGQRRFRELYESAGAKKLIWGSNYSPVLHACSYAEGVAFVREHCTFLTAAERDAIMGGNMLEFFTPSRPAAR